MKKYAKLLYVLGIITSVVAFCVLASLLTINRFIKEEFLPNRLISLFRISVIWLAIIMFISVNGYRKGNKNLYVIGMVLSAIAIVQTFAISAIPLFGFLARYYEVKDKEKEREEKIQALPEEEQMFVRNNDINFRYAHVDYAEYVKKYKIWYIVSIFIQIAVMVGYVFLVVWMTKNIFSKENFDKMGPALIYLILFGIFYFIFVATFAAIFFYGFVAIVVVLACPTRKTVQMNQYTGMVSLSFVNAMASKRILKEIDDNISKSIPIM